MLIARIFAWMLSVVMILFGMSGVSGQDYPSKTIRIVTGGVGGSNDFVSRLLAPRLTGLVGQPVIVDNRSGGLVPGQVASQAPPDGYTLLFHGTTFWIGPLLRKTTYDPIRDFASITLMSREPQILIVHPSLPARSVKELIALAKIRPGDLNYSHSATGGTAHLGGELFKSMAGVNIVTVAYSSDSQEMNDLLSGQVQLTFQGGTKVAENIKSGKLRALAVGSLKPSALFPGLPAVAAILPGFEHQSMQGAFAPTGTPAAIIKRLNQEIVRILNTADVKEKFSNIGVEVVGSSPEEATAAIKAEIARVSKVIKDAGIRTD